MDTIKDGVQKVVNDIYSKSGQVRPSDLLKAAKEKNSPAHDAFEWNDKKAGHQYRLIQARFWIRRVEIIVDKQPERLIHVPHVAVDEEGVNSSEGYYKPMSVVIENADEFELARRETLNRLNAAKAAFETLKKAASKSKSGEKRNLSKADKGFQMVESALS